MEISKSKYTLIDLPLFYKDENSLNKLLISKNNISNNLLNKVNKIMLKINPKDPNCHYIVGESSKITGILIKCKINKKNKEIKSTEIMGKVPYIYKFNKLADFIYTSNFLPENETENGWNFNIKNIIDSKIDDINVIPPIYSTDNKVIPYFFKGNKSDVDNNSGLFISSNQIASTSCQYYEYSSIVPDKSPIIFNNDEKYIELHKILEKLFNDKPIWTLNHLKESIDNKYHSQLKYVLPSIAFVYSGGPWRHCLVRYGYNPKIDINSYKYQIIEFRIKSDDSINIFDVLLIKMQENKKLWGHVIKKNTAIYLFDITDDYILKLLDNVTFNINCDEKSGWLPMDVLQKIRDYCRKKAFELYDITDKDV